MPRPAGAESTQAVARPLAAQRHEAATRSVMGRGGPMQLPTGGDASGALDWLEPAGGIAGAIVGGAASVPSTGGLGLVPEAMAGAGIGGAAGRALRNAGRSAMGYSAPTGTDAVTDPLLHGAGQAALEGGGQLLGAGVKATAKPLMQAAQKLGLADRIAQIAAEVRGVPMNDPAADALALGVKSPHDAHAIAQTAGNAVNDKLTSMANAGVMYTRGHLITDPSGVGFSQPIQDLLDQQLTTASPEANKQHIIRRLNEFLNTRTTPGGSILTPAEANAVKSNAWTNAQTLLGNVDKSPLDVTDAGFHKALGHSIKQTLEHDAEALAQAGFSNTAGLRDANALWGKALNLRDVMTAAEAKGPGKLLPLLHGAGFGITAAATGHGAEAIPAALLGAGISTAVRTPGVAARAGLAAANPLLQRALATSPRAIALALQAMSQPAAADATAPPVKGYANGGAVSAAPTKGNASNLVRGATVLQTRTPPDELAIMRIAGAHGIDPAVLRQVVLTSHNLRSVSPTFIRMGLSRAEVDELIGHAPANKSPKLPPRFKRSNKVAPATPTQ